jgi:hypothetical protein
MAEYIVESWSRSWNDSLTVGPDACVPADCGLLTGLAYARPDPMRQQSGMLLAPTIPKGGDAGPLLQGGDARPLLQGGDARPDPLLQLGVCARLCSIKGP